MAKLSSSIPKLPLCDFTGLTYDNSGLAFDRDILSYSPRKLQTSAQNLRLLTRMNGRGARVSRL